MFDDAAGQESHKSEGTAGEKTEDQSQRKFQGAEEEESLVVEDEEKGYPSGLGPVDVPDSVATAAKFHVRR